MAERQPASSPQKRVGKLSILLLTADDGLWPQIGRGLREDLQLKQVDNLDELLVSVPAGQPAVVLWDARAEKSPASALSRLQLHSAQFATVALAEPVTAAIWNPMVVRGQLVAYLPAPFDTAGLRMAIDAAVAEVEARAALLGSGDRGAAPASSGKSKLPSRAAAIALALLAVTGVAYWKLNQGATHTTSMRVGGPAAGDAPATLIKAEVSTDDKVFQLLEAAQQAMRERRYIEPAAGSAIALYREALLYDPNNDEAHQGMQRIAEILFSRVQSALDERKFDLALQSLETARSIDPADRRIATIDARIVAMRSDIGSAQILAALNAQAFDRAALLLDEAAKNKSLPEAKIAQLREETAHRRSEAEIDGLLKLVDARLQQDRLVDPRNDNASYYLEEARKAGAGGGALQSRALELARRVHARETGASAYPPVKPKSDEPSGSDPIEARRNPGPSLDPDHENATAEIAAAPAAIPEVNANQLHAIDRLNPEYPRSALSAGTEGWVELSFTVTADGKIADVTVIDSMPRGVFDRVARDALMRTRYQPFLQNGHPTAVTSRLRVSFQLAKH
jgi:TonB family protein